MAFPQPQTPTPTLPLTSIPVPVLPGSFPIQTQSFPTQPLPPSHAQISSRIDRPIAPSPFIGSDIKSLRTACEFSLRELLTLQKRRHANMTSEERLRAQAGIAVSDLRALKSLVSGLVRDAESNRGKKWIFGVGLAAIIPGVRKLFRRSSDAESQTSANDTEYAFKKSKTIISRIKDSVHGKSRLASIAMFVLAVLYVFQSEVSLRVARTMNKRLKKLVGKIERGEGEVKEEDVKILGGWRWRILLW
ncbi:hypothetical protein F5Y18DRAFT_353387 [Xylariaceae sp. FL1019]|nr:hypothetical protein F5Y18DRAFT_353387 [Xylariaceae sp. FL1019]